ncbi:MAG: ABC transporter permease [Ancrocorticia sp.]
MRQRGRNEIAFPWLPELTMGDLEAQGLRPIGNRPGLGRYVRELWRLRHFIVEEARGKSFQSVRGTVLGRIWLLIEPFINAAMYLVMFGILLPTGRGIDNFLGYLFVGSIMFTAIQRNFAPAGDIIRGAQGLIRSFTFPRAALVFSFAIRNLINTLPALVAMLLFITVAGDRVWPSIHWLAFAPVLALMFVFNLGLSFLVAALTAHLPDLKFIWQLASTFWFMLSGVFFDVSRYYSHPAITFVMESNPAYVLLTMGREVLLYQRFPTPDMWQYFSAWALGLFALGFLVFWFSEESYGALNDR